MRLHEDKKAYETGWEDNPSDFHALPTYPRWGCAGREGLVCIDTDDAVMAEIVRSVIPHTFETQSPRRELPHFYLKVIGGQVPNRTLYHAGNKKGGEIRANNHYLVAPGTEIRYKDLTTEEEKTGRYTITQDIPIATMTFEDFMEKFKIHLKGEGDESQRLRPEQITEGVEAGERHAVGIKFATRLVGYSGLSPDQALASMRVWNQDLKPPMDDADLIRMVKNAKGYVDEEEKKEEAIIEQLREEVKGTTEPTPAKATTPPIKPLHEKTYYWIKGKKGPIFLHDRMLLDIVTTFKIITFPDIEVSYLYNIDKGTYTDNAINEVKKFMLLTLADTFKKSVSEEVIYQLKILTSVNREDYEPPFEYFNVSNGVLNVFTRELIPHSPKFFFLDCSPIIYDATATRLEFNTFISELKCAKIDALQEFSGSLLEDTPKHKKALMLNGPTDSSKTTFTNAITNVIGIKSICGIPIQNLEHRFQQQRLYKKRVNLCGDLGSEAFNKVGLFKRTTGGDPIEAELKGANKPLNFIWGGKHWFDVNEMPNTEGDADTDAFYNRLVMVTFPIQVPKTRIDKNLPLRLALEGSGILNWMLDGLDRLESQGGFSDSTSIDEIRDHYKRNADNIYSFVKDRCYLREGEYVEKIESYRKYVQYCIEKGYSQKGKTKFYEKLTQNIGGIKDARCEIEGRGKPWVWMNLFIVVDDKTEDEDQKDQKNQYSSMTTPTSDTPSGGEKEVVKAGEEHGETLGFLGILGTAIAGALVAPETTLPSNDGRVQGVAPEPAEDTLPTASRPPLSETGSKIKKIFDENHPIGLSSDFIAGRLGLDGNDILSTLAALKKDGWLIFDFRGGLWRWTP